MTEPTHFKLSVVQQCELLVEQPIEVLLSACG
jgi:hypothetical protein